jgi:hypothetical protein
MDKNLNTSCFPITYLCDTKCFLSLMGVHILCEFEALIVVHAVIYNYL